MPLRSPKPLRHKPPPELIYIDDALVVKNSMDAELKGKTEQIAKLRVEIDKMTAEHNDAISQENAKRASKIAEIEAKNKVATETLTAELKSKIAELETNVTELKQTITDKDAALDSLTKKKQEISGEIEVVTKTYSDKIVIKDKEINDLKSKVEDWMNRYETQKQEKAAAASAAAAAAAAAATTAETSDPKKKPITPKKKPGRPKKKVEAPPAAEEAPPAAEEAPPAAEEAPPAAEE